MWDWNFWFTDFDLKFWFRDRVLGLKIQVSGYWNFLGSRSIFQKSFRNPIVILVWDWRFKNSGFHYMRQLPQVDHKKHKSPSIRPITRTITNKYSSNRQTASPQTVSPPPNCISFLSWYRDAIWWWENNFRSIFV